MEKLISSRVNKQSVPESYVFPPEKRPGNVVVRTCNSIPVIDLGGSNQAEVIEQILRACEEYGFFQLVNHGVPLKSINDMMGVAKEFFEMPVEERAKLYSEDPGQIVRVKASISYDNEDVHYWRESLRHPSHPVEKFINLWPEKPSRYSNGRLKSIKHRVATNSTAARTTVVAFIYPDKDSIIAPAPTLVDVKSSPLYRAFRFQEFASTYADISDDKETTLKHFKL